MSMRRIIVPGIIVALLAAAAFVMFQSEERKTLTAHFPRTVSIYEGSEVRVLGVPVGTVKSRLSRALARVREHLDEEEQR